MKARTPTPASFVQRFFLALHATVPAAVLVAVLVHLWPPAGLPPLAQRPVWAVWTLIGTWLLVSLLAALALRNARLWRVSLAGAGMLLVLAGAMGLVLDAPLRLPMLACLVALGLACTGLAAAIGPARVQPARRSPASHAPRRSTRWRWPGAQALSFWLAAALACESFRIAHVVGAEPTRPAGMVGLLIAFFLALPAATLQAWWPRAAAVLATLAALALAGLAWRSNMPVWGVAAALCMAMAIPVLRQRWVHHTPAPHAREHSGEGPGHAT